MPELQIVGTLTAMLAAERWECATSTVLSDHR
jgi:hypothetical protein